MVTLAPYDLLSQSFDPIEPRGQTFRFDVELPIIIIVTLKNNSNIKNNPCHGLPSISCYLILSRACGSSNGSLLFLPNSHFAEIENRNNEFRRE